MKDKRSGDLLMVLANPKSSNGDKFEALLLMRERLDNYKAKVRDLSYVSMSKKLSKSRKCVFCASTDRMTIDHIKPLSKGGANTIDNVQTLCYKCNQAKGDEYPFTQDDLS